MWQRQARMGCGPLGAGLWSLDDVESPETKQVMSEVRERPERFVLKPQREGGGNNLYGKALLDRLQDTRGLEAFILMQRIRPPIHKWVPPATCTIPDPSAPSILLNSC